MNKMPLGVLENIRTGTKAAKTAKSAKGTQREEASTKVYETNKGLPYIPSENLFSCLVAAGQSVRLDGKRQVSTAKSTVLPSFLTLEDPYILLVDPNGKPAKWDPDLRQGRNPNGGEAVAICRPRFDAWAFTVHCEIDTAEVGENLIRELWDKAGRRIGLGDFRPHRRGLFGQFVVENWIREAVAAE